MGTDNRAEFVLSFEGDGSQIGKIFSAFKNQVKSEVGEIEQSTSNIVLFKNLKSNLDEASASVTAANANLAKLRDLALQVIGAGESVGKDLAKGLKDAEKAATSAAKEFDKQTAAVDRMGKTLAAAGVDTKALGTETIRLATQLKQAQQAEAERQAASTLGIKLTRDQTAELAKANAAYQLLRTSGSASVADIANAQKALITKTEEINSGVAKASGGFAALGSSIKTSLAGAILPFVGLVAIIGSVTAGLGAIIAATKEYRQGIAELGTVTNLTQAQLNKIGDGARQLSRELGLDLKDALKGLFELIRSGVPEDNALEVLRVAAIASKAALADLSVGVKASNVLLDSFGLTVGQLPAALDMVIASAKNGGPTLNEFAESGAGLGNAMRATGQNIETVIPLLQVMSNKSNDAAGSAALLAKILINVAKPETRANIAALGITTTNLGDILQQIDDRAQGGVNAFLQLGVAGGKAGVQLSALTNNLRDVPAAVETAATSAGTSAKTFEKVFDTSTERAARFNAELEESKLQMGELFSSGGKLASWATTVLKALNDADLAVSNYHKGIKDVAQPTAEAASASKLLAEQYALLEQQAARTKEAINAQTTALTAHSAALLASVTAIQAASDRDIADITKRADAEIAQLDRSREATAKSAAETLRIKLQLAADTLASVQANEQAVTDATLVALAARAKAAKNDPVVKQKLDEESTAIQIASVGKVLARYQALYASLNALAQDQNAKAQAFEDARVGIAKTVEDAIRNIRLEGLSGIDAYAAKIQEVDRLISEGRKAAAQGDTNAAKGFFDQAIQTSNTLTKVVTEDGVTIVSATQAQAQRVAELNKVLKASGDALGDQREAAKKGAEAAQTQAENIGIKIRALTADYEALKKTAAEGLLLTVKADEDSIAAATAKLDELTKPRTVVVTVETVNKDGTSAPPTSSSGGGNGEHFAAGGPVGAIRRFARGGGVAFRRPSWLKVPGTGSGDTVPAALQAGSFVVKKSASAYYGDGVMSRLARGYAGGGTVGKGDVQAWAEKTFGFNPFGNNTTQPIDTSKGFRSGDSFQSDPNKQPPISFDTRPIPEALLTSINVLSYAREMLNAVGINNPLLGSLLPQILNGIKAVEANPKDGVALKSLLQAAETIGANPYVFAMWGKTTGAGNNFTPTWFIDWLEKRGALPPGGAAGGGGGIPVSITDFAKSFFGSSITPEFVNRFFGANPAKHVNYRFAGGGSAGSDTVPALLTPGEFVVKRPAAQRYGSGFLHAVNNMQIPRDFLANMMQPPRPPARFADGGPVSGVEFSASAQDSRSGNIYNVSIQGEQIDEKFFRTKFVPFMRQLEKQSQ